MQQESAVEQDERKAIRVWMRTVMANHNWTANGWATRAGTSTSNITRFLNSDSKFIPSARTLAKLAAVAGSSPPLLNTGGQETTYIKRPVYDAEGLVVDMIVIDDDNVEIYKLGEWSGMGAKGIFGNSTVVVEPKKSFKELNDGDIILYKSNSVGLLCAEYRNHMLNYYPADANNMPQEFNNSNELYWSPIKTKDVGDKRLVGKVIQMMLKF
jgi:transcriptional regulator with XRE-family HTH domain